MIRYSLVIPVYRNSESIDALLDACDELSERLNRELEVVFVVDGSPDDCYAVLHARLPDCRFASQLLLLSRNFGSFAAIREGLRSAKGRYTAVMAADLQEPPELIVEFFSTLEKEEVDLVCGVRTGRADPLGSRIASNVFWWLYRRLVQPEMSPGGVDVFGCNEAFRTHLLALGESNSSLVGLLYWMGFRRKVVPYSRRPRLAGRSAWTFKKKLKYLSDSVFAFSDLPIRLLTAAGAFGMFVSVLLAVTVFGARVLGLIQVPGYTATVLVVTFFAALNSFGLGVIGSYIWRTFENTKGRPTAIVMIREAYPSAAARVVASAHG